MGSFFVGIDNWVASWPPVVTVLLGVIVLLGLSAPWLILAVRSRAYFKKVSVLEADRRDLNNQIKKLKHRTNVLARALSQRDDTPNSPDSYVRPGLSAQFKSDGARPAMVNAESYIYDDELDRHRGHILARKPKKRSPPVLPSSVLDEYRKRAVNE